MPLNPNYIVASNMQSYFVDIYTGQPLAGGVVTFYRQNNPTVKKPVYTLQNNVGGVTYAPLPNPLTLSVAGTIIDSSGNDVKEYYYPVDADGNQDLYYITVTSANAVPQFTRSYWPNPNGGNVGPVGNSGLFNYIPNGQFLCHTDLPYVDNILPGGSTVIAQGGFTIELPASPMSVNTASFSLLPSDSPYDGAPRYALNFSCTEFNSGDDFKIVRVKFYDVNKFTSDGLTYTFGFSANANIATPVDVNFFKYFGSGGSISVTETFGSITLNSGTAFYSFNIQFGDNNAYITGPNNDDYIAIDLRFPLNQGFSAVLTDFVQVDGAITLSGFPVQTNADMITRSIYGWTDLPNANGFDLYLPPILTRYGMTWDLSQIGDVGMSIAPLLSPASTSPVPNDNRMPAYDGETYITANYSANGIPYARLGQFLIAANAANNTLPMYGTGPNYVISLSMTAGSTTTPFRITYNVSGTGSTNAINGNVGPFSFMPTYLYNSIGTGAVSIGYSAFGNVANTVLAILQTGMAIVPSLGPSCPFTVTALNFATDLLAQQNQAFTVLCTAGSTLNPTGAGYYFKFGNSMPVNYYMWFNCVDTGLQTLPPASGPIAGYLPIQVNIFSTYTAQQVADAVREALNTYASTLIQINTASPLPASGSYFTFYSNPSALRTFYIWYNTGSSSDPMQTGTSIEVKIQGLTTAAQIATATLKAINGYQYAAPNFSGMFFRATDFAGVWDMDVTQRWSNVAGIAGAMPGTFEFEQLLSHLHAATGTATITTYSPAGGGGSHSYIDTTKAVTNTSSSGALSPLTIPNNVGDSPTVQISSITVANTGGSETRPVNAMIFPYIRY